MKLLQSITDLFAMFFQVGKSALYLYDSELQNSSALLLTIAAGLSSPMAFIHVSEAVSSPVRFIFLR